MEVSPTCKVPPDPLRLCSNAKEVSVNSSGSPRHSIGIPLPARRRPTSRINASSGWPRRRIITDLASEDRKDEQGSEIFGAGTLGGCRAQVLYTPPYALRTNT